MNTMEPVKEFVEEVEAPERKCLFCTRVAPARIRTEKMTNRYLFLRGREGHGWYSSALLNLETGAVARFYLCPDHVYRISDAWEWARRI